MSRKKCRVPRKPGILDSTSAHSQAEMAEYPADYLRTEQSGLYCTSAARRAFSALGTRGSCASAGSGDSHRNNNERLPPLVFEKAGFRWRKRLGEPLRVDAVTHCFRNRLWESQNPQTTPSKLRNVGYTLRLRSERRDRAEETAGGGVFPANRP